MAREELDGAAQAQAKNISGLAGRKRKHSQHDDAPDPRTKAFDIRPISEQSASSRTLRPKYLLPRAHLPLSWLDISRSRSGLYAGDIFLLETTYERGIPPSILIAEDIISGARFVLERSNHKQYVVLRLTPSIEHSIIARRATWLAPAPVCQQKELCEGGLETKRRRRVAPVVIANPSQVGNIQAIPEENEVPARVTDEPIVVPENTAEGSTENATQAVLPDEAFEELAKQYLEALYLSKTSLAYFVKGPLSRLRSLFPAGARRQQCSEFLRQILLRIDTTDKRLKETIPNIIKDSTRGTQSDDDGGKRRTRKRAWRPRRDRQGLLVGENECIKEWWDTRNLPGSPTATPESLDTALKRELAQSRVRETFLQIIITLELLAIADVIKAEGPPADETARVETVPIKIPKKPIQLDAHLETLLERLVIWHSLDMPSTKQAAEQKSGDHHPDELRNFCVEVIIPFYFQRIPKVAGSVNKKLGGPGARSPLKRHPSTRRPGDSAVRPLSAKQDRPVDATKSKAATLRRSATDTQLSEFRHSRRDSSVSISVTSARSSRGDIKKPVVSALDSLTRREIDLSAASAASKDKLKKKSEQEARVREAVAAIRKPDRLTALQDNAALVDAKFAQSLQRSRKPARTTKRLDAAVSRHDVHIQATPSLRRTVSAIPRMAGPQTYACMEDMAHVGSSALVPQTSQMTRQIDVLAATPSRGAARYTVADSISRPALARSPLLSRMKTVESTPSRPRYLFPFPSLQTPVKADTSAMILQSSPAALSATPIASVALCAASPNAMRHASHRDDGQAGKSIYDALGWNDESYEELA